MDFRETALWNNSIANAKYGHDELREKLINIFLKSRDNADYVLKKIRKDFFNLTVHDISHVDGLWRVASVIIGNDYEINPMESFVLGCAFLMHDAVLSYDAAGGVDHLRELPEWKDYYEDYKKERSLSDDEKLYETDFKTIRSVTVHGHKVRLISLLFYSSLAIEAAKTNGSYKERDVTERLKADFHDKCYICEIISNSRVFLQLHPYC